MKTQHYLVENLDNFSKYAHAFKNYLNDIEKIFGTVEEVFGKKWTDNHIHVVLKNSKNECGYDRLANREHIIYIGILDDIIQKEKYPKNLWGCLLHETLHAFMNPIIHRNNVEKNDLDGYFDKEPFIRSFQGLIYLKLKERGILEDDLCNEFLERLESELFNGEKDLYKKYIDMFSNNPNLFSKFIEYLNKSQVGLIHKNTFEKDLENAKIAICRLTT